MVGMKVYMSMIVNTIYFQESEIMDLLYQCIQGGNKHEKIKDKTRCI